MRVLVTGASGFIGRHALEPLRSQGFEVHGVSARGTGETPGMMWHTVDLHDRLQRRALLDAVRPTHLLHLAWSTEHGTFWTSPKNLRWVATSLELLLEFVEIGGQRAVMAGTCAEYDWTYGCCSEVDTPRRPATIYGVAKNALFEMSSTYAAVTGLSLAWGRVFFLFGPGEPITRFVPSVASALLHGTEARCTAGHQRRDFLHVRDVAAAFVALLRSDVRGAINIGSGSAHSLSDIAHRIATSIGRPELLRLGALPTSPDEPPLIVADVTRLRNEVGWYPTLSLDDGLADVIGSL